MADALLKHAFVSPKADGPDPTKIRASNWNAALLFSAGVDGEILVRSTASATGAAWTDTLTSALVTATGNVLVTGPGGTLGLTSAAPLVVQGVANGLELINTAFAVSSVNRRWQLHNSDSSGFFEFNYFTGSGTAVQTGWQMNPANGLFYSVGGVLSPNHSVQRNSVDVGYFGSKFILEGSATDDMVIYSKGDLYIGAGGGWPARTLRATAAGLELTGVYLQGVEQTAPAAPAANGYRLFAQDNGSGKTQLMCLFATGAAQQVAIQP